MSISRILCLLKNLRAPNSGFGFYKNFSHLDFLISSVVTWATRDSLCVNPVPSSCRRVAQEQPSFLWRGKARTAPPPPWFSIIKVTAFSSAVPPTVLSLILYKGVNAMSNSSQALLIPAASSRYLATFLASEGASTHNPSVVAEALLKFSSRLAFRSSEAGTWFFLDLSHLRGWIDRHYGCEERGEVALLNEVLQLLAAFGTSRGAIADTPQAAQGFADNYGYWISPAGAAAHDIAALPLSALSRLEGVQSWPTHQVDAIAGFFSTLGFHRLSDLRSFSRSAFHERWGELGDRIHRRLQGRSELDPQPIPPYLPTEPLTKFVPLDFPVTLVSLLLHEVESAMRELFARLEGRRLVVRQLHVRLRCEYSNREHSFAIEPSLPSRDFRFFQLLLENRLGRIELLNPIKDIELRVEPLPEKEQQAGFLEQQTADQQKLALLSSLLRQEGLTAGFAGLQDELWPEAQWRMQEQGAKVQSTPSHSPAQGDFDDTGFAPAFAYAESLREAPRPSLLLLKPRLLAENEVGQLRFLSRKPVERLEGAWWENRAGPAASSRARDYYVARAQEGQVLWLFRDRESSQFFLHGAFD